MCHFWTKYFTIIGDIPKTYVVTNRKSVIFTIISCGHIQWVFELQLESGNQKSSPWFKGGAFFSRISRKCIHLRGLKYTREFSRFFDNFLCKWKLRSRWKKSKSFLPPSLVFYPTFVTSKVEHIWAVNMKSEQTSRLKKWGKKLVRG